MKARFLRRSGNGAGLILLLSFIVLTVSRAVAEQPPVYEDFSLDRTGYQSAVAELKLSEPAQGVKQAGRSVIVLCRTDGTGLDLYGTVPARVISGPRHCFTLLYSGSAQAEAFIREAAHDPGVLYAEMDQRVAACEIEDEAGPSGLAFHSWGAEAMHLDQLVDFAARAASGASTVAVIDSGVGDHPFLRSRIGRLGYDYIDQDDDPMSDGSGHGTRVAGIVADCTQGAAVSLIPIRVLDDGGYGRISNLVNAIEEAAGYHADLIQLSLASESHSDALHYAIEDAVNAGCCVVAAAGNQGVNVSGICPGHMVSPGLITVGSVEADGGVSGYSNYGSGVDVYCYGSGIVSCDLSGGYSPDSGTSMAAPHIAGLCALEKALHPGLSPSSVKSWVCGLCETAASAPDASAAVPRDCGVRFHTLRMGIGQQLPVPVFAFPASSNEQVFWESDQPAVADVREGTLKAFSAGRARFTVSCLGFEPIIVCVEVSEPGEALEIGGTIGEEAFADCPAVQYLLFRGEALSLGPRSFGGCAGLSWVRLPEGSCSIASDAFDSGTDAVFFCRRDTEAAAWALGGERQYVLIP